MRVPIALKGPRLIPESLGSSAKVYTLESRVLKGNPLGDPTTREVGVYTPPSGRTEGRPLLILLQGFTGAGWMLFDRRPPPFQEGLVLLLDRLIRSGECGEAVLVAPDALTCLGGSQYVNSSATGRYADHILDEVVPWAHETFGTGPVGVLGQSSGGFGALHLALERPGTFEAVGSSAGDMAFDLMFPHDFALAVRHFNRVGGPTKFLESFLADPSVVKGPYDPSGAALLVLAMAACYSPTAGDAGAFELPFDPITGERVPEVWQRWLAFDPVVRVAEAKGAAALRSLKLLHVTAGTSDEWALDVAARVFVAAARRAQVPVLHEEIEGGHFQKNERFRRLFVRMVAALNGTASGSETGDGPVGSLRPGA